MKAAFFVRSLPPPSAGPWILSWRYGPGTGSATDACKPFVVKGVVRDIMLVNVSKHLIHCPIEQWVKLEDLVAFIPFQLLHCTAVRALFSSQAGDPDTVSFQGPL